MVDFLPFWWSAFRHGYEVVVGWARCCPREVVLMIVLNYSFWVWLGRDVVDKDEKE